MVRAFVEVRARQSKAQAQPCSCGRAPVVHRTTTWTRKTLFGPVEVKDPYVYCPQCHESARPLHSWLGTDRETWSPEVQEAAVDLASDESCGRAVAKLGHHHVGVEMDRSSALRLVHEHGEQARAFIDEKLDQARKVAELPPAYRPAGAPEPEVEFDGGMIPVATPEAIPVAEGQEPELTAVRAIPKRRRNCRWEEAKVGLVQKPGEVEGRLYSVQPTGGLDKSFDDLLGLVCLKGRSEQTQMRGLADGARHIRMRPEETFGVGRFRFIPDRPHCQEHLSEAGQAPESLTGQSALQWVEEAMRQAEAGLAAAVVAQLQQAWQDTADEPEAKDDEDRETLRPEASYLERNQDAVAYAYYREQGWSTASSEVESAHGHVVQARLKISGAWWHPDHVDDILALRELRANGWWDEYWDHRRKQWRQRAAGFAAARPERPS
jgi:hypothetical protein